MRQRDVVEQERKIKEWLKNCIIKPIIEWGVGKDGDRWFVGFVIFSIISFIWWIFLGSNSKIFDTFVVTIAVLAFIVLYRVIRPLVLRFWDSFEAKVIITSLSLISLLWGRILADRHIASLTDVPASILPRAQDALSLAYTLLVWFFLALMVLWLLAFLLSFHHTTKSSAISPLVFIKYIVVWFTFLAIISGYKDRMVQARSSPFEYLIVWASFIPNDLVPPDVGPPPDPAQLFIKPYDPPNPFHHCPSQPKDVWVAFMKEEDRPSLMKEDAVLVAVPATPTETHGS